MSFEQVRNIGARLGLCLARIQLSTEAETSEGKPVWF